MPIGRSSLIPLVLLLLAGTACGAGLSAWDPLAAEPRPLELPDGLDPNDPHLVYRHGAQLLARSPASAAEAFHRASRLDPLWADPIYARRMALFMTEPRILYDYLFNRSRVDDVPGVARLDSLQHRALAMNPFLLRKHDAVVVRYALTWRLELDLRRAGAGNRYTRNDIEYALDNELLAAGPEVRAWVAEGDGRLAAARDHYATAVDRRDDDAQLRTDLARMRFHIGEYEAAQRSLEAALELLREEDEEELVTLYRPKVLLEHSIGLILEQRGDVEGARGAYARALQEDLSYAPAHIRLAELALAEGDTLTALSEFALAVSVAPEDAGVHYLNGGMLARAGRLDEAATELARAIQLEPLFAAPYGVLGEVLDRQGRVTEAAARYREFLDRASRISPDRARVERRLADLSATGTAGQEVRR